MFIRSMVTAGFLMILSLQSLAQSDFNVYDYWARYPDPSNNLYHLLLARSMVLQDSRNELIQNLKNKSDWIEYKNKVQKNLANLIGSFPEKTPLHATVTSVIDRSKYLVEKLHFQSRPDFYVTAAFFIPKNISKPAPAILFCSGHSADGFRSPTYQHMILNYVQKGFIVLAFDPIGQGERHQYFDEENNSYLAPTREHSYPGNQIFINGLSPANYFIWDGIRAIDYLVSRPEVDPGRIGVTGRSGGGTQTAYLMAMDDRVAAAAPECYLTTYDKLLRSIGPQDAEQIIMHFLDYQMDLADLVHVRAPKPTLMVTTTRDIFSIQGARDLYAEAKSSYTGLGFADNLDMVEDNAPHASTKNNREASYAFFQKHLQNPGSNQDEAVDTFSLQQLWVTENGRVATDLQSETLFSLNKRYTDQLKTSREKHQSKSRDWKSLAVEISKLIGYESGLESVDFIYSGTMDHGHRKIEKYLVAAGSKSLLPVVWLKPAKPTGKICLLLDDRGKKAQFDSVSLALQLLDAGMEVVLADLSGIGEMGGGYGTGDAIMQNVPINVWYAGILTNKSLVGIRVEEIRHLLRFIGEGTSAEQPIELISVGSLASEALHASALGLKFNSITLIDPLISYESLLHTEKYLAKYIMSAVAGSFPIYDLPELAHYAGDKLLVVNAKDALDNPVDKNLARKTYGKFRQNLSTETKVCQSKELGPVITRWLTDF